MGGVGRAFVTFSFAPVEVIGRRTGVSNDRARQTVGGSANWFRHRFFAQRTGPLGDGRVCIRVCQLQKQHVNIAGSTGGVVGGRPFAPGSPGLAVFNLLIRSTAKKRPSHGAVLRYVPLHVARTLSMCE